MYFSTLKYSELSFLLEICVDSVESACIAEEAGAGRLELCSALSEGGITPSQGLISMVRNNVSIDLNVIIRPRSGDFLYNDAEFSVMRHDIDAAGEAGANGIVTGILLSDGNIDIDRMIRLVDYAYPMNVTFHRAFDMCHDPYKAVEDVIATGAKRLLTSGHAKNAIEGINLIKEMVEIAGDNLIIMPGCGIDEFNIASISRATGTREFHLSARTNIDSQMTFRRKGINMGGQPINSEYQLRIADADRIRAAIKALIDI
jgi:copper homeostasis protein